MRAKEYECFVVKIQRLENLCRALQDERNVLYKKIKEAKFPEEKDEDEDVDEDEHKQTGQKDSLSNEAVPTSTVTDQAAAELSVTNESILKNLAKSFTVIHHVETPILDTTEDTGEALHDLQAGGPVCPPEPVLLPPLHQVTGDPIMQSAAAMPKAEECRGDIVEQPAQGQAEVLQLQDADMEDID